MMGYTNKEIKKRKLKYLDKVGKEVFLMEDIYDYDVEFLKELFYDMRAYKMQNLKLNSRVKGWHEEVNRSTLLAYKLACDRDFWFEFDFLKIQVKGAGKPIPLARKNAQERVKQIFIKNQADGNPDRYKFLKSRQVGISTFIEGYVYLKSKRLLNSRALIIADKKDNSVNLYSMYGTFFANDSTKRPGRLMSKTLIYDPVPNEFGEDYVDYEIDAYDLCDLLPDDDELSGMANGGFVRVDSGFNKQSGRSFTIQFLHCSEIAFWEDPESSMAALMQVVPNLPETGIFYETTANGVGNWWYDCWHTNDDGFVKVFIPWIEDEDCSLPIKNSDERKRLEDELTDYELEIIKDYNGTLENIKFRRQKLGELHGNEDLYNQEYPLREIDAFLGTGRPVFSIPVLKDLLENTNSWNEKNRIKNFNINVMSNSLSGAPDLKVNRRGDIKVWTKPKKGHSYVIGADPAEGLIVNQQNKDPDFSTICVLDRGHYLSDPDMPLTQVAQFESRLEPDDFTLNIWALAEDYNRGWVNVEANNDGKRVIAKLHKKYNKIMRRPSPELINYIKKHGRNVRIQTTMLNNGSANRYGWHTNSQTRNIIIKDTEELVRNGDLVVMSTDLIAQCQTMVYDDLGRPYAQKNKHDDLVFALGLAVLADVYCQRSTHRGSVDENMNHHQQFQKMLDGENIFGMKILNFKN